MMLYRWMIPSVICIILISTIPVAAKNETNILVLGQYQGQYETLMINLYRSGSSSAQIISIHPGAVFVDGPEVLQQGLIQQTLHRLGIDPIKDALASYLDIELPYYLIVDYAGAQEVVDALGGVSFDLPYSIQLPATKLEKALELKPGKQIFDGQTARRFLRYRSADLHGPEELQIIELQQIFLNSMIHQLTKEKWKIIPVALKLPKMIKTNLGIGQFFDLAIDVIRFDPQKIKVNFGLLPGEFIKVNGAYQYQIFGAQKYRLGEDTSESYDKEE